MEWYFELRNMLGMITTMVIIPGRHAYMDAMSSQEINPRRPEDVM